MHSSISTPPPSIHSACASGDLEYLNELIKKGADLNSTGENGRGPLHEACFYKQTKVVQVLLANNADPNLKERKDRSTPLHIASLRNNTTSAALLLDAGANINCTNHNFLSPLHQAAISGSPELLELFFNNGAEINERTVHGYTLLALASESGNTRNVTFLVEKGASSIRANQDGEIIGDEPFDVDQKIVELFSKWHFSIQR